MNFKQMKTGMLVVNSPRQKIPEYRKQTGIPVYFLSNTEKIVWLETDEIVNALIIGLGLEESPRKKGTFGYSNVTLLLGEGRIANTRRDYISIHYELI